MSGAARLHLRRSAGLAAFPAFLASVGLHVLARDRLWVHEWLWAVYQYHFVTVLLGPVAAGVAAWEGQRVARADDLSAAAGARLRAAAWAWAAVMGWVLATYAIGLAAVIALVRAAGTPGWPDATALSTLGPPIALLAAETSTGFVVGLVVSSPLVPPLVATAWFLLVLFLYVAGPATLVTVGGSSSLLGLAPRRALQAAQVELYLSVVAASAAWVIARPARPLAKAAACLVGLSLVALGVHRVSDEGPRIFQRTRVTLACIGSEPTICVGPGYVPMAHRIRALLGPYLDELRAAGAPVPSRFDQTALPGEAAAPLGGLVYSLLRYDDPSAAPFAIIDWYLGPTCDVSRDPAATAFDGLATWLQARVGPRSGGIPEQPVGTFPGGSLEQQRAWVRHAVRVLSACGR
ncbi:MAG TPA: hypothetical protein VNO79_07570 [Actinomycetota bacterium]|nr:hypothetical protein [Actinomycetota bacterium]